MTFPQNAYRVPDAKENSILPRNYKEECILALNKLEGAKERIFYEQSEGLRIRLYIQILH